MEKGNKAWSAILTIIITIVVISTAYLASGMLHDRLVPEEDDPVAVVTLVSINTVGLGGTGEHPQLPVTWSSVGDYDVGVKVTGLRSESGVVIKFSLSRTGISASDVDVFYFDAISNSWRSLTMQDQGNQLVANLGLSGGIAIYEGYEFVHRLIIFSHIDGACTARAWVEVA